MADWSQLPADLLMLIARRLHFAEDYVRFSMACKSWRAVCLERNLLCSLLPWLMVDDDLGNDLCGFYCPFNKKHYELYLPEISGTCRRYWGSSCGWLITLDAEYQLHIVNPISRVQIQLPPLHKCSNIKNPICDPKVFQNKFVSKVYLSSSPLSGNCVVLAIYSYDDELIAFSKPGDEAWTPLQCSPAFVDGAIYFDEKFYVTNCPERGIIICDSNGIHLKTVTIKTSIEAFENDDVVPYIVELCGQIHLIFRIMCGTTTVMETWTFRVFRLDICMEKWEDVENLGNWCIFLGRSYCFAISTSDYPECSNNCIYFSDEDLYPLPDSSPYDMGVYTLDTQEIQTLHGCEFFRDMYTLPVWIKPVLR